MRKNILDLVHFLRFRIQYISNIYNNIIVILYIDLFNLKKNEMVEHGECMSKHWSSAVPAGKISPFRYLNKTVVSCGDFFVR